MSTPTASPTEINIPSRSGEGELQIEGEEEEDETKDWYRWPWVIAIFVLGGVCLLIPCLWWLKRCWNRRGRERVPPFGRRNRARARHNQAEDNHINQEIVVLPPGHPVAHQNVNSNSHSPIVDNIYNVHKVRKTERDPLNADMGGNNNDNNMVEEQKAEESSSSESNDDGGGGDDEEGTDMKVDNADEQLLLGRGN